MAFFRQLRRAPLYGALAGLLALGACGGDDKITLATVEGFAGLVSADEPNAAVVGREVLGNGGLAADAAVAMYFTLAVTYPSRASLSSGGACVIYERDSGEAEALVFPPLAPSGGVVPLGPRAMAALHARYGGLRWETLIAPSETLARFGFDTSRALAQDFAAGGQLVLAGAEGRRIFAPGGQVAQGQSIVQPELAGVLGAIRQQGAGYLHGGPFAARYQEATTGLGHPVTAEALRASVPQYVPAVEIDAYGVFAYFTPPPLANGLLAAQLYTLLTRAASFPGSDPAEANHLFLEASARAFAERAGWLGSGGGHVLSIQEVIQRGRRAGLDRARHQPSGSLSPAPQALVEPAGGTGFVVGDRFGNAVACGLTMNGLFGNGQIVPDTGIVMAAAPPGGFAISPVAALVGSRGNGRLYFAGAAGDGAAAATALVRVMLEVLENDRPLAEAQATGRVHHNGLPDAAYVEQGVPASVVEALRARGHEVRVLPAMGLVNAFFCEDSLRSPGSCTVSNDPRGAGLSRVAQ